MLRNIHKGTRGFTLIELLAVMAIVAVLAGIVAISVSGSGESSRDAQTQQDATTVNSAVASFFSNQPSTEVRVPRTVTVLGVAGVTQETSTKWPEVYITDGYPEVFPEDNTSTVDSIVFLNPGGIQSDLTVSGLLSRFNAIDFAKLEDGGFLPEVPDSATVASAGFNNYLWLLEKTTAAGGSGEGSSRKIAVFKLTKLEEIEGATTVKLSYQQIVGFRATIVTAVNDAPIADAQSVTTDEDTAKAITLTGSDVDGDTLTFSVATHPPTGPSTTAQRSLPLSRISSRRPR